MSLQQCTSVALVTELTKEGLNVMKYLDSLSSVS